MSADGTIRTAVVDSGQIYVSNSAVPVELSRFTIE